MYAFEDFNHSYKEERNIYWHVGLYTAIIAIPWGWHLYAETCSSWCASKVVHNGVQFLDDYWISL